MTTTDVRQWLAERGEDVSPRGPIRQELRDKYAEAHPDMVTTADFPPDDPEAAQEGPAAGERPPRKVRTVARRSGPRGGAFWAGAGKGQRKRKPKHSGPRRPVTAAVEGLWSQLAWSAGSVPPVQKLLYAQAPYAGIVLEDTIRGTVVDAALQPVIRAEEMFKAVNGLVTPPLAVMMILTKGQRDETGEFDPATRLMFGMLRTGLMSMIETTGDRLPQIMARADELKDRGHQVDEFIAWLFAPPGTDPGQPAAGPAEGSVYADPYGPAAPGPSMEDEAMRHARAMFSGEPSQ